MVELARSVAHAIEILSAAPPAFAGCLVEGRLIDHRWPAALAVLQRRLRTAPVVVLKPASEAPGAEPPGSAPPRVRDAVEPAAASPLPRADGAPDPGAGGAPGAAPGRALPRWTTARFATRCLALGADPERLLRLAFEAIADASGASRASLLLLDEDRRLLKVRAARGLDERPRASISCPVGRGVAGRVLALGHPVAGRARSPVPGRYSGEAFAVFPLGPADLPVGVVSLTGFPEDRLPDDPALAHLARLARVGGTALATALRLGPTR
jgi:hypothetical protein